MTYRLTWAALFLFLLIQLLCTLKSSENIICCLLHASQPWQLCGITLKIAWMAPCGSIVSNSSLSRGCPAVGSILQLLTWDGRIHSLFHNQVQYSSALQSVSVFYIYSDAKFFHLGINVFFWWRNVCFNGKKKPQHVADSRTGMMDLTVVYLDNRVSCFNGGVIREHLISAVIRFSPIPRLFVIRCNFILLLLIRNETTPETQRAVLGTPLLLWSQVIRKLREYDAFHSEWIWV